MVRHDGKGGRSHGASTGAKGERLGTGLGWFGVGLGLAQVVAPGSLARLIGVRPTDGTRWLMRGLGAREVAGGLAILLRPRAPGLWARVGGDAMDLALLGRAFASGEAQTGRLAAATAAVVGATALDVVAARRLAGAAGGDKDGAIETTQAVTINRPPEEVYRFWRDLENLPRFMTHLESVEVSGGSRSHWEAKAPMGRTVEWDAEITQDRPGELIAWRSLEGADVENSGSVRFTPAPGGRGTEVRAEIRYKPPAGALGATVAKLFGEAPDQQAQDDLRRLKQVMETGEIVRSDGSPGGRNVGRLLKQQLGQPPDGRTAERAGAVAAR